MPETELKFPKIPVEWELKFRAENLEDASLWSGYIHKFIEAIIAHKMYETAHMVREGTVVGFKLENKGKLADSEIEDLVRRYLPLLVSKRAELTDGNADTTALEKSEASSANHLVVREAAQITLPRDDKPKERLLKRVLKSPARYPGAYVIAALAILAVVRFTDLSSNFVSRYFRGGNDLSATYQTTSNSESRRASPLISDSYVRANPYPGLNVVGSNHQPVGWVAHALREPKLKCDDIEEPKVIVNNLFAMQGYKLNGSDYLESFNIVRNANECNGAYEKLKHRTLVRIPVTDSNGKHLIIGYEIRTNGVEDLGKITLDILRNQGFNSKR